MAEVEDATEKVNLKSTDRSFTEYVEGVRNAVPLGSATSAVESSASQFTSTVVGMVKGGENAPGVGEVATAATNLVLDTTDFVAGAAGEITSFASDPIAWLVSNGLDMLLSVVTPLQDMLHYVTGDGPALKKGAENFVGIATGLEAMGQNFVEVADDRLKEWKGDASQAGKKALAEFADGINGVSAVSARIAEALQSSAILMETVEAVVKSLISDFVAEAVKIMAPRLALSIVTFGASIAEGMAEVMAKLAQTFPRIMRYVEKITRLLGHVAEVLAKAQEVLGKILGKALGKRGGDAVTKALFTGASSYVGNKFGAPKLGDLKGSYVGEEYDGQEQISDGFRKGYRRDKFDTEYDEDGNLTNANYARGERESVRKSVWTGELTDDGTGIALDDGGAGAASSAARFVTGAVRMGIDTLSGDDDPSPDNAPDENETRDKLDSF